MWVVSTDRQTDNSIFYKVETYLDCLLVPNVYVIPNFVKICWAVLGNYQSCFQGQTNNPIFCEVETYLDCLLVPEIYEISNFVKIGRAVLENYESCVYGQNDRQTDRQPDFLQGWDLSRSLNCILTAFWKLLNDFEFYSNCFFIINDITNILSYSNYVQVIRICKLGVLHPINYVT